MERHVYPRTGLLFQWASTIQRCYKCVGRAQDEHRHHHHHHFIKCIACSRHDLAEKLFTLVLQPNLSTEHRKPMLEDVRKDCRKQLRFVLVGKRSMHVFGVPMLWKFGESTFVSDSFLLSSHNPKPVRYTVCNMYSHARIPLHHIPKKTTYFWNFVPHCFWIYIYN